MTDKEKRGASGREPHRRQHGSTLWRSAVAVGVLLRVAVVVIPGNRLFSPWSGKGDVEAYFLLAKNLVSGRGYTYASVPSAYRPPLLPMVLAGLLREFGGNALAALRWIQFFAGIATVYFVYRLARRMFGEEAARAALLIALFFPTLIYTTSEVLSECLAAFLATVFLLFLARQVCEPANGISAALGCTTSLAALARFNLAILIVPGAWATLERRDRTGWFQRLALMSAVSLAAISPWIIRNWIEFDHHVVLGTTGGYAALQGVVSPAGRAQTVETEQKRISGWLNYDLETNSASRRSLPSELALDRTDWRIAQSLWKEKGWNMLAILAQKLGYFWLSTDQLLDTSHFRFWVRVLRASGVLFYWLALAAGIVGWLVLRSKSAALARLLLFYTIVMTATSMPFTMDTRHRLPVFDPLIAALAGGGWLQVRNRWIWSRRGRID